MDEDSNWKEVKSKSSAGNVYYFNCKTGESVWQVPTKKQEHVVSRPRIDKAAIQRMVRAQLHQNSSSRPSSQNSVHGECTEAPVPSVQMGNSGSESMVEEKLDEEVAIDIGMDQASLIEMFDTSLLRDIRASFQIDPNMKEWYGIPLETSRVDLSNQLFIVLDTNVLLTHLKFLNELQDSSIEGIGRPVLVIPWVVLLELDVLKKGAQSVSLKAMKAIMFLLDCFTARHSCVCEQSLEEVHTTVPCFDIDSNDDRILHCCLVYKQKLVATNKVVLLFTNDSNLCSKALVCNVAVANRKTLLGQLRELACSCTATHNSSQIESYGSQGPSLQPAPPAVIQPAPAVIQPAPAVIQPAPAVIQPAPAVIQPAPAVIQPAPAVIQPAPAVIQPAPAVIQPAPAVIQPAPAVIQPAPAEQSPVEGNRHKSLAQSAQTDSSCAGSLLGQSVMILRETLSIVIKRAMHEAYDDLEDTIVARKPPWSLDDTLFLLERHWVAVFQFEVARNQSGSCQNNIKILKRRPRHKKVVPTMKSVRQFVEPALQLLHSLNAKHNQYVVEPVKRLSALLSQAMPVPTLASPSPTPISVMPHTPTAQFPRDVLSPSPTDLMQYSFSQSSSSYDTLRNALGLVHESVNLACNGATGQVDLITHMKMLRELILSLERILEGGASMLTASALHSSMQQYLHHVLQLTLPLTSEQLLLLICANPETISLLTTAFNALLSYT